MGWLTDDDLRRFATDGYLVVQDVVPESLLARADSEIDGLIDTDAPNEGNDGPGQNAWFTARSRLPRCDDVLRRSPALRIAEELVSPNTLDHAFDHSGTKVLHQTGGHSTLLEPPLALSPQIPITGRRGDLLLAHFLLGHNKGGNTAPHDRRTIYYRLAAQGHPDRWEQTFLDAWTEYPPVQHALSATDPT